MSAVETRMHRTAATDEARGSNGRAAANTPAASAPDPLTTALAAALRPIVRAAVAEALEEHAHAAAPTPALLTREQLAQTLGCSIATISRLRGEGLPVTWLLDSPRYELLAVLEWLRSRGEG